MSKVKCSEGDTIYFKFEGRRHKAVITGVYEHVIWITQDGRHEECFLHSELEEWAIE